MKTLFFLLVCGSVFSQQGNIGIGTTVPQQKLHIASSSGTIRIDGLNSINNSFNEGDTNGDLDLSNDIFPLYVNNTGTFDLSFTPFHISEEADELDDTTLTTNTILLLDTDTDGIESTEITSYSITVLRATILEVKYNISFAIYNDTSKAIISDNLARRVNTYFTITGQTRIYGSATKNYSSGSINSSPGILYTNCTAYISLPAAGTYDLKLIGAVSSDTKGNGGGPISQNTYVEFAIGNDSLFLKLH
ncbi:hypothetical protein [Dokdonia sp.]|uniref:hypothetical protein n=1 Tax=Dokdonia sp. TaxID=2024995 RepID=UPI0032648559